MTHIPPSVGEILIRREPGRTRVEAVDLVRVTDVDNISIQAFTFPIVYKPFNDIGSREVGSRPTKAVVPVPADILLGLGAAHPILEEASMQQEVNRLADLSSISDGSRIATLWDRKLPEGLSGADMCGVFIGVRNYRNNQSTRRVQNSHPTGLREAQSWVETVVNFSRIFRSDYFNKYRDSRYGMTRGQFKKSAVESIVRLADKFKEN